MTNENRQLTELERKDLLELSVELTGPAQKTREHKIGPDDTVGGTFAISNLGGIGTTDFAPIVYWPQVAIPGMSRPNKQPL